MPSLYTFFSFFAFFDSHFWKPTAYNQIFFSLPALSPQSQLGAIYGGPTISGTIFSLLVLDRLRRNETQLPDDDAKKVIRRHAVILIRPTVNTPVPIKGGSFRVHLRHFQHFSNMSWFTMESTQAAAWREVSALALLVPDLSLMLLHYSSVVTLSGWSLLQP
jgi:hypothetical protein